MKEALEGAVTRRRPKMSRQARKRIAEAQRRRWAEWRAKNAKSVAEDGITKAPAAIRARKKR